MSFEIPMSTYRQILYQIVFGTRFRAPAIHTSREEQLHKFISGIIINKGNHLYRINGMPDHLHILTDLNPTIALSDLIKDIKLSSTAWIRETGYFPSFKGWQQGYGAFTYHIDEKDRLIDYIKYQKEHHRKETFEEEYRRFLNEHRISYDERYLL